MEYEFDDLISSSSRDAGMEKILTEIERIVISHDNQDNFIH